MMLFKKKIGILLGNRSDAGRVREKNEDSFGQWKKGSRRLFAVADGMGGEAGGQLASRLAVDAVRDYFEICPEEEPRNLLHAAVLRANRSVIEAREGNPEYHAMGTTIVLVLVEEDKSLAWIAHVGDSRIYLLGPSSFEQLTKDHTRVQQMLDAKILTPEEAADHPQRHILSKVIGSNAGLEPDVSVAPTKLKDGWALLMCSDGLSDAIQPEEMAWAVSVHGPQKGCEVLADLANQRGGHDNITIQIIYAGTPKSCWQNAADLFPPDDLASYQNKPVKKKARTAVLFAISCLVLLSLLGGGYYYYLKKQKAPVKQRFDIRKEAPAEKLHENR
jgi:PPM family protein phosphatase